MRRLRMCAAIGAEADLRPQIGGGGFVEMAVCGCAVKVLNNRRQKQRFGIGVGGIGRQNGEPPPGQPGDKSLQPRTHLAERHAHAAPPVIGIKAIQLGEHRAAGVEPAVVIGGERLLDPGLGRAPVQSAERLWGMLDELKRQFRIGMADHVGPVQHPLLRFGLQFDQGARRSLGAAAARQDRGEILLETLEQLRIGERHVSRCENA